MNNDDLLFSKEIRDALTPWHEMDITDALNDKEFLRTLAKMGGVTDEELEKIFAMDPS